MERRIVKYVDGVATVEEFKTYYVNKVEVEEQKKKLAERKANAEFELKEVERLTQLLADAEAIIAAAEEQCAQQVAREPEPAKPTEPIVVEVPAEVKVEAPIQEKVPFQSF